MATKPVLLGRSTKTTVDNTARHQVVLPGTPSVDFVLTTPCLIVNVGARISMTAADLPGESGGTYTWSSPSTKIQLVNTTGGTLVVKALAAPSAARDAETITVTRTAPDGSTKVKTVSLTVAKVTFSPAATQKYGYDDFDTPLVLDDDHLSVKSSGDTLVNVKIEGGALGSDFNFVAVDPTVCTCDPAPGTATFDLTVHAKTWQKKASVLQAKVKCPSAAVFAKITVHVYTEKVVKVLVAKVADSASAGTTLTYATADYAAHQAPANDKLKEAVVKYEITNFDAANNVTNVAFDTDASGALSYDINNGGGAEFNLIKAAVTSTVAGQFRVVIIKEMKSYYYLSVAAAVGDTTITVRGANVFQAPMVLDSGANKETVTVTGNTGNVGTLSAPLAFAHPVGTKVEFPAAGWGNDPIMIAEGSATLDVTKWTILHEVGHRALELMDIVDTKDFMHFSQANTDYRLRFCPRVSKYKPGVKENQWDKIPRPAVPRPATRAR
ncbi:MAG: hypothetical protein ACJ8GW_00665 [Massilia sp.]